MVYLLGIADNGIPIRHRFDGKLFNLHYKKVAS